MRLLDVCFDPQHFSLGLQYSRKITILHIMYYRDWTFYWWWGKINISYWSAVFFTGPQTFSKLTSLFKGFNTMFLLYYRSATFFTGPPIFSNMCFFLFNRQQTLGQHYIAIICIWEWSQPDEKGRLGKVSKTFLDIWSDYYWLI